MQIEDVFDTWLRDSDETYLYWVLPAASYLVTITYADQDKSIQLACNAGDLVFIQFIKNSDGVAPTGLAQYRYDLEVATEFDGRAAIEDRRLILFEDIYAPRGNSKNPPSADMVRSAEAMLNQLGFNAGEADGIVRGNTVSAVLDYQYKHGLPTTGEIDEDLIEHLRGQIADHANE